MDDLKVGEYVRTNDGIFKVTKIDGLYIYLDKEYFDNQYQMMRDVTFKERILKHSFNIIDLIEVGDYVNGNYVSEIKEYEDGKTILVLIGIVDEKDIKTILTKEQYQANCYTVERKEE